jgi:homoserine kinase type II
MAVYTHVSAEALTALLEHYDVGALVSAKGIAEGVENSNYLVDTTKSRFILTLYEKRVDAADLPFFIALLDHLAARQLPVPRAVADRQGRQIHEVAGRPACLIEFLPGVSVSRPTAAQAHATGLALGDMHRGLADFAGTRPNSLGPAGWAALWHRCGTSLDSIGTGLRQRVEEELAWLQGHWPDALPRSVIHADLFPDNVLMRGNNVTGIIDFYFACTEIRAWDLAVTHASWCFDAATGAFHAERSAGLIVGYRQSFGLSREEQDGFRALARGACLRFLLTRAWDWLNTPPDALVTRKDPLVFLRRLDFYRDASANELGL